MINILSKKTLLIIGKKKGEIFLISNICPFNTLKIKFCKFSSEAFPFRIKSIVTHEIANSHCGKCFLILFAFQFQSMFDLFSPFFQCCGS